MLIFVIVEWHIVYFSDIGGGGGGVDQRMDLQSFLNIGYAEFIILDVDKTIQFEKKYLKGEKNCYTIVNFCHTIFGDFVHTVFGDLLFFFSFLFKEQGSIPYEIWGI